MAHVSYAISHSTAHTAVAGGVTLPPREEVLLNSLKDRSLTWQLSRSEEQKRWESNEAASRTNPNDEGLFNGRPAHAGLKPHANLDWHTIETKTLHTKMDLHDVKLQKIHTDSYSHDSRRRIQQTLYSAEFTSLSNSGQRVVIEGTKSSPLASIFENILA